MLFQAIEFAARAHSGQYRKTTRVPYIIHPLSVAKILIQNGCSEEVVTAGVLHDTLEDTSVTIQDLQKNFGSRVAQLIECASEPPKSESWETRKQHTLDLLKTASLEVMMIVGADKLDNVRSIREDYCKLGESIWSCFSRPKEQQSWYFESLVEIFAEHQGEVGQVDLFQEFAWEVEKLFGGE
ncbi:HD domain-containing protein [bacterium]|nr:HD domain-containing protein [bacterium]